MGQQHPGEHRDQQDPERGQRVGHVPGRGLRLGHRPTGCCPERRPRPGRSAAAAARCSPVHPHLGDQVDAVAVHDRRVAATRSPTGADGSASGSSGLRRPPRGPGAQPGRSTAPLRPPRPGREHGSPIRSSARWLTSSSARSAMRGPAGLDSARSGAVRADRRPCRPRRSSRTRRSASSSAAARKSAQHARLGLGLAGEPADHVAADAGLAAPRRGSGRSGPGTSPGPRTGASGAAPWARRAGRTGRSTAPPCRWPSMASIRLGRISAGCR